MVMTNEELTAKIQAMHAGMQVMEGTLEKIMPQMDAKIREAKALADGISETLEKHITPIVQANVIETLMTLDRNHAALAVALDDKVAAIKIAIDEARDLFTDDVGNSKMLNDQIGGQLMQLNQKLDGVQQHMSNLAAEFGDEKTHNDSRYASTQSQMPIMQSQSSTGTSSHGSKKTHEPLVCHK